MLTNALVDNLKQYINHATLSIGCGVYPAFMLTNVSVNDLKQHIDDATLSIGAGSNIEVNYETIC